MKKILLILAAGAVCSVATAQEAGGGTAAPQPQSQKFFEFEAGLTGDYAFRSDVDGGGDVASSRVMSSLWLAHSFSPDLRATLLVTTEFSWYDFKNATGLIAGTGKPFSQLVETDITPGLSYKLNDTWTALGGVYFRFAAENGADTGDSFTVGGYAGARYRASDDLSITMGVRISERIEEDTLILPAFALDWNVSPTVRVQVTPAVGGTGVKVTSTINEHWAFLIDGEYQTREFRLNDDAALPEGVVRDSRVTVGLGVLWKPCDTVEITARAGMVAWQEFRIDNSSGDQQSEVNTDPTPYVYLGGSIHF